MLRANALEQEAEEEFWVKQYDTHFGELHSKMCLNKHQYNISIDGCVFFIFRNNAIFEKKKQEDPTTLINTFEVTELVGIVSLLYGMLLHSGAPSRSDTPPPELPQATLQVTITGLKMLNYMAVLNLDMLQV